MELLLFSFQGSGEWSLERGKPRALKDGGVAQLGEHLPCKQGVMGSIPIISTKIMTSDAKRRGHDFVRDFRQSEPTPISQEIGMMCAIENDGEAETNCAHLGSDSHHLHR